MSGSCLAQLTKVGEESYISKLTHRATQTKEGEQSEMIRSLNRLVQAVGIVIIPIGVVLFIQQFVAGQCDKYGRSDHWNDTGGTLSVSERCHGGKCHASGKAAGFDP